MRTQIKLFFITIMSLWLTLAHASDMKIAGIYFIDDMGEDIQISQDNLKLLKSQQEAILDTKNLLEDVNLLKDKLPQYQNITTRIEPIMADAVEVLFEFQMKRKVKGVRVKIEDNGATPKGLRDKLSLRRGEVFSARNLELDRKVIYEEFVRLGYPKVKVSQKLETKGNKVMVTLFVKPGSRRVLINEIKIEGNKSIRSSKLKREMKTKTRSWFLSKRPGFQLFNLDQDMKTLENFYADNGFLHAKSSFSYQIKNDRYITITIHVNEGEQFLIKNILVHGNREFSENEITEAFGQKDSFPYSEKLLRKGVQNIREFYGQKSYSLMEAMISYDSDEEELHVLVNEGGPQKIEKILIKGNKKMKAETILQDVDLEEGAAVNTKEIAETLEKLKGRGIYSDIRIDYLPKSKNSGDIVIQVKEANTSYIRFGAGMSNAGPMGELSIGTKNLFHTGKRLSLHMQKSQELTRLGIVYKDPHLMGSDLEFYGNLNYQKEDLADYDKEKIQALLMIEKTINKNLKVGIGTRIEFLNIDQVKEELSKEIHDAQGDQVIVGLVSTLFYTTEKKDAAGDAMGGYKVRLAMLPSYSDEGAYVKTFTKLVAHKSIAVNKNGVSHTLSGGITMGYISENAPFHEKYYAGGISTLKGFEHKSIGTENGDGGNMLVATKGSYSFPLWGTKLKGVAFVEAASVGDNFSDLASGMRAVGGLGVKANLRETFLGATLESGFAIPLKKQNGDITKPFYFIFGDYDPAYDI